MWMFRLHGVRVAVLSGCEIQVLKLKTPSIQLDTGEGVFIGAGTNGDLLQAAGFNQPEVAYDTAVPIEWSREHAFAPAISVYKHPEYEGVVRFDVVIEDLKEIIAIELRKRVLDNLGKMKIEWKYGELF